MAQARFGVAFAFMLIAGATLAAPARAQQPVPSVSQTAPQPPPSAVAPPAAQQQGQQGGAAAVSSSGQLAPNDPVGSVASVRGTARVTRAGATVPLKAADVIFKNDVLATGANSALDITFEDETTFNLGANSRITVNEFVYADGGADNSALFDIARGTVAFVANQLAKTGDMKIATPTATLGIRGTSGLIEVPEGATAGAPPGSGRDVAIKLYADASGAVGRIEVFERAAGAAAGVIGARLGLLSQAATGFAIRGGIGGRFAAAPLVISAAQIARDRGLVGRVHAAQGIGRGFIEQRRLLRQQPGLQQRPNLQRQPGLQQQQRPGLQQQRPGLRQPDLQRQPGPQQQRPGFQQRQLQRQNLQQPPGLQRTPNLAPQPGAPSGLPQPAALPGQPGGAPLPGRAGFGGPPPGAQRIQGAPGQSLPGGVPAALPGRGPIPTQPALPAGLAPRTLPGPQPVLPLRGASGSPGAPALGRPPAAAQPVPGLQRVPAQVRQPAKKLPPEPERSR